MTQIPEYWSISENKYTIAFVLTWGTRWCARKAKFQIKNFRFGVKTLFGSHRGQRHFKEQDTGMRPVSAPIILVLLIEMPDSKNRKRKSSGVTGRP